MPRNIEIKACIESVDSLLPRVSVIADSGLTELFQEDTFFHCPNGRLKLRVFSDRDGQLIFYKSPDNAGPKESFYIISPATSPHTLCETLSLAYGQSGKVSKNRTLFLVGHTRVHLDRVEGLGHFLELEVVLSENESSDEGVAIAHGLLSRLGISHEQLIEGAYVDLSPKRP